MRTLSFTNYPTVQHLQTPLERYLEDGIMPGGFLTAVLENDLQGAFSRADSYNIRIMLDIVKFMYNQFPCSAYGSVEKVKLYVASKKKFQLR